MVFSREKSGKDNTQTVLIDMVDEDGQKGGIKMIETMARFEEPNEKLVKSDQSPEEDQQYMDDIHIPANPYADVFAVLYSVRDAERKVSNLEKRIELHRDVERLCAGCGDGSSGSSGSGGDDRDDWMAKAESELGTAQMDVALARRNVIDIISRLDDTNEQSVMISRYIDHEDWGAMARSFQTPKPKLKQIHSSALPKLQDILKALKDSAYAKEVL